MSKKPGALHAQQATGPLRGHPTNQRYFTDGTGKAIYLTGSHTWTNLVDRGPDPFPAIPAFDYTGYLDLMQQNGHNFMRMWAWENTFTTADNYREYYNPHPFLRTNFCDPKVLGSCANDGLPKFNLTELNQDYFTRLYDRVHEAGQRGIYVSVMLFQGWSVWNYDFNTGRVAWDGSYFHRDNNINGIDGDANNNNEGEEVHRSPGILKVTTVQQNYVRKVIDTLNDLDNVLYEISNESHQSSTAWQYDMINFIQSHQSTKPKQHPVGMTAFGDLNENKPLVDSPAEWISPHASGFDQPSATYAGTIPAALDDSKVSVLDP